jgi:hypothetical protein
MKQFNQITYNEDTKTLDVGAGLTWGDIYKFLDTPKYSELGPGCSWWRPFGRSLGMALGWRLFPPD